ncbi:general substrate transporter [Aspergillus novoparasiticus]|uniref:General substrate transporter n=1 Tax=Aspergillus novoparasiticus TaxID=986946 RepID=A0A5N6EN43_9EURO|nr:general substrate transporter [Aspergillus novoparasiticus]
MTRSTTSLAKYIHAIRDSPREVYNYNLAVVVVSFALCGCAKGWDEGSASAIIQLKSFERMYDLDNNTISNIVSFVNLGAGVGALLSFLLNDRIGRRWSMRLYQLVYIIGSLISCFYGNIGVLYAGRLIAGLGIGALTVVGPMTIAEVAPKATRGLMTLLFNVCMLSGQALGVFTVYGCSVHISPAKNLQYQIPWFTQTFAPSISIILSFFAVESPRWIILSNKRQSALASLLRLRGLPANHPYVDAEYNEMVRQVEEEDTSLGPTSSLKVVKETFFIRSNLRRVQLSLVAYILAQMSGANSVTNYLPTIFGMLIFCVAASLCFVDVLGRRKSLMTGITIQIICHSYLAGYLSFFTKETSTMPKGASDAAIAFIYIHALGWAIGLYTLPYLFGAELWPSRIRSFGGALSQCFHWLFYFAITKATPSLFTGLHTWGAFVLFAGFCLVALVYTFFLVPETSGLSLEEINKIFERPLCRLGQPLAPERQNDEDDGEKQSTRYIERA